MSANFIRTRLKALFLKDDLVDQYVEKYGEILNLDFVEQFKEELRCEETGETPTIKVGAPNPNVRQEVTATVARSRDSKTASFIRIKLKAIFMKESLVDLYLQRYGEIINQQYIDDLKAESKAVESGAVAEVSKTATSSDAIFESEYNCPVCRTADLVGYHLRSKSQVIEETLLLVPHYSSLGTYAAVDYSLLQTIVCPKCLYASPDPKDWTRINKFNGTITDSQLSIHTNLIKELRLGEKERHAKYPDATKNPKYFARPRDTKKGLESIELSLIRAQVEKKYLLPAVNYKIGKQYLKYADIKKRAGEDNKEWLNEAENYFTAAVKESDCNNLNVEMECMYLVIVLSLARGDKEKAGSFIKIAKDLLLQKQTLNREEPSAELRAEIGVVDKWLKRITLLWEWRDDESYWTEV